MSAAQYVVGIDLGGTNMQVALIDAEGRIIAREHALTRPQAGADDVIARIAAQVRDVCAQADVEPGAVRAVGIGAPGAIDPKAQIVIHAPNIGWRNIALGDRLSETLAGTPVVVDNDVNVAAWGENRHGAGRNAQDVMGVWVGTGVGAGLILNGSLYAGGLGTAGEIGHVILFPDQAPENAHMEHHCSRGFVLPKIMEALEQGRESSLLALYRESPGAVTFERVAEAYASDDALVREFIDRAADLLGFAIGNAVSVLGLPLILLGGGIVEDLGARYVERVTRSMRAIMFPPEFADRVEVRPTELGPDAGIIGAGMLAWDRVEAG